MTTRTYTKRAKDYSLRSADYNEKRNRLKRFRSLAAERNPDEFHFAMMSSKTRNGGQKVAERGNQVLSQDAVRLLKTQDAGYLRTMAQRTRRMRERLEQAILLDEDYHLSGVRGTPEGIRHSSHIVFEDTKTAQEKWGLSQNRKSEEQPPFNSSESSHVLSDNSLHRAEAKVVRGGQLYENSTPLPSTQTPSDHQAAKKTRKRRKRNSEAKQNILKALKKREGDLRAAEQELDAQRARLDHRHSTMTARSGVKFRVRQRKR